ncbi:MAG: SDR family NAD(P)-dependent oxidoreductase [Novosphingobium sp.]|nr:SDR family NAD(P)-dependent oxidoreductase [Novosphingobium sp.]
MTQAPTPLDRNAAKSKYGPWAVIAGASDGTGEGFARELAAMGINLLLISRRREVLEALGEELKAAHGIEYRVHVQDLMVEGAGQAIIDAASDLDVGLYVSNAGADAVGKGFIDEPLERWLGMITMNVTTVVETCYHFGRKMRERGGGGLLVMSSGSALGGIPFLSMYSSTKAFEGNFCEGLWAELKPHNVDVLSVLAPLMDTPCFRRNTEGTGFLMAASLAWDPFVISQRSLDWLPHGPLLIFPNLTNEEDRLAEMDERRARVEGSMALGESFNEPA